MKISYAQRIFKRLAKKLVCEVGSGVDEGEIMEWCELYLKPAIYTIWEMHCREFEGEKPLIRSRVYNNTETGVFFLCQANRCDLSDYPLLDTYYVKIIFDDKDKDWMISLAGDNGWICYII